MVTTAEYRSILKRDICRTEKTKDGYGHISVKIGEEMAECVLTVDMAKVMKVFEWKIRRGKNKATLCDGAIQVRVVNVNPVVKGGA